MLDILSLFINAVAFSMALGTSIVGYKIYRLFHSKSAYYWIMFPIGYAILSIIRFTNILNVLGITSINATDLLAYATIDLILIFIAIYLMYKGLKDIRNIKVY